MNSTAGYHEFWKTANEHYPGEMREGGLLDQRVFTLIRQVVSVDAPERDRFQKTSVRSWTCNFPIYLFPFDRLERPAAAPALTYKGLLNLKNPFDLALYTRLIWELQPRTIIELGSFHGGSGLWYADQMSVLCKEPGEVHSFDLHVKCISPSARHPRLHFHHLNLADLGSFDTRVLQDAPHPWLVVDDAHVNVLNVFLFLDLFMQSGDYYVVEDVPMYAWRGIVAASQTIEDRNFLVDTHYTDAYGYNVTCAPNGWLRKS